MIRSRFNPSVRLISRLKWWVNCIWPHQCANDRSWGEVGSMHQPWEKSLDHKTPRTSCCPHLAAHVAFMAFMVHWYTKAGPLLAFVLILFTSCFVWTRALSCCFQCLVCVHPCPSNESKAKQGVPWRKDGSLSRRSSSMTFSCRIPHSHVSRSFLDGRFKGIRY